jgi:hypothetical protein
LLEAEWITPRVEVITRVSDEYIPLLRNRKETSMSYRLISRLARVAALGVTAYTAWACSEQNSITEPPRALKPAPAFNVITPSLAIASLCPEGPAGNYTYTIALNIPASYTVNNVTGSYPAADLTLVASAAYETITVGTVSYPAGTCQTIGQILQNLNFQNPVDPSIFQDPLRYLTITQTGAPANTQLDKIITTEQGGADVTTVAPATSATIDINFYHGAVASFWNSPKPPPLGTQGCTPGYWKQSQHYDSWTATGYNPGDAISTVFTFPASPSYTVNALPMGGFTLVQGLGFKGGNDLSGKAQILIRAAIAAVLNASNSSIQYGMSKTDIINKVNAALAGGDATAITNLGTQLDGLNNGVGGCPLN